MFIELTDNMTKSECLINLNSINTVSDGAGGCMITFNDTKKPFFATEKYSVVKKRIEEEVAAERGY